MRFLNEICQMNLEGLGRLEGRKLTTLFHTSHPGLCGALRHDKKWRQLSAALHGGKKKAGISHTRHGTKTGYGGHFRAVQGFRYYGEAGLR